MPWSVLEGSLRNDTQFDFAFVRFEVVGLDSAGTDLKICDASNLGSRCEFQVRRLNAGETAQLREADVFTHFVPSRILPKGIAVASSVWRIIRAPYFVKYEIEVNPVTTEKFTIKPVFGIQGIQLEVQASTDLIEVLWDQSVYIGANGRTSRLIRGNVRLMEKDRPQPNTVIPPGTKSQETVFPVDQIEQNRDGSWHQVPLLPEIITESADKQLVQALLGKEVRLFLRLLVNDQKHNVTIPFKITKAEY